MTVYTFADLSTPEMQATIRARLVAALIAKGVPVASWAPSEAGGVENLRLDMVSGTLAATSAQRIAQAVTMRVLPTAVAAAQAEVDAGTINGPAALGLRKLGRDFYKLPWRAATSTIQNIRLGTFGTPGSYTFNAGDLWVRADSTGNRYTNINADPATLTPGQTLDLPFQAENPGSSYADVAGTILTMVTAKAGVSCTNVPPAPFTASRTNGSSSGRMVATFTDPAHPPATPPSSIRVLVTGSGNVGVAFGQLTIDGGKTFTPLGILAPSVDIGGGITLAFQNGATPSFLAGDILTVFLGDCILQRGADAPTPQQFGRLCSNRWPSLSPIPTRGKVDLWTHLASDEVDRVWSGADPNRAAGILVTIASSSGPASPQAQIDVEDFITARLLGYKGVPAASGFTSPEETVLVTSAKRRNVIPQGAVFAPRNEIAAIQAAATKPWLAYLRGLPIGGSRGALVSVSKLIEFIMDAGADRIENALIGDGVNLYVDMFLLQDEVAEMADGKTLANTLTWSPS